MNLNDRILRLSWLTVPEVRAEVIDIARAVEILEQQVRRLEREADASPWRTGTPPESGAYLVMVRGHSAITGSSSSDGFSVVQIPPRPVLDSWGLVGQRWTDTPKDQVLAWMPVPKWEGER